MPDRRGFGRLLGVSVEVRGFGFVHYRRYKELEDHKLPTVTKKQLAEYEQLKRDKNNGRILTPDGLRFICQAYNYDPEEIGKTMLENLARISSTSRERNI